jgi:outer membrane protein assembly complex protein YaeT
MAKELLSIVHCTALVLLLSVGFAQPGAYAQAPQNDRVLIADVQIAGNRSIPADQLLRFVRSKKGDYFNAATVAEDIRRLHESRLIQKAIATEQNTQDGQIILIFQVVENRGVIRQIIYKHANHISDKELESMTRLKTGMPMNASFNEQVRWEIEDYLRKKGRYHARVVLEEGNKDTDNRVVFNVTEGPVVCVRSVSFQGQDQLASAARLRTQIDTSKHYLRLGGIYQPGMVENDKMKLEEYYRNNGFLNVRVEREIKFSEDLRNVDITFFIHEGPRYRVEYVKTEGVKIFSQEEIDKLITTKKGQIYNRKDIQTDLNYIEAYYGYRGYKVTVKDDAFPVPDQDGVVRVQYQVREEGQARVGTIYVVGNESTRDNVPRRYLGNLLPGQILSYPDIRIAEANLARSGLFAANPETGERPTIEVVDNPNSIFKDLIVRVRETTTGSVMLGAGVSSNAGLVGQVVINEKNFDIFNWPTSFEELFTLKAFRGGGQEFRIEAAPGTEVQRYVVSFREPFLFDLPYSFGLSGYYYDRIFNEYIERRYGGRVTFGHQINNRWGANIGARIENVNVRNVPFWAPSDYTSVQGDNFQVVPRAGITYDTRDSFLRPTEGEFIDTSFEYALGDVQFPIINVNASKFFTTFQRADGSGKHVIALKSQVGWAGSNTPVYERFFAGGFQSLRGFQFRGVGPVKNGFFVGGDFLFMNSIEYQLPIRANDNLYLVGFVDTGTVESGVEIKDYRVSAGLGLRIVVPMMGPVPIALDFGFPIVRAQNDQEQIFSFYVGFAR